MDMKVKKNIAIGLLAISMCSVGSIAQPKTVEAGWLGDVLGSVIGSASGGKVIKRNNATQIDKILHQACKNNDYDMAVKAIEQGAKVNSMYNDVLPLSYALGYAGYPKYDTRIAELLVSHGADIEGWYDKDRKNFFAFNTHHYEAIDFLVNKGLNVNIKGNNNISLLMHVVAMDGFSTAKISRYELMQKLVNKGADVNVRATGGLGGPLNMVRHIYKDGSCALSAAAQMNDMEAARILLYAGANKNSRNNEGKTPLDIAIEFNHPEMINLLMGWN